MKNRSIMSFKLNKPDESEDKTDKPGDAEAGSAEHKDNEEANERKPIGKLCNMGHKYGYILPDSTVKRCCSDESGQLGNMMDGTFKMHDIVQICPSTYCHCE